MASSLPSGFQDRVQQIEEARNQRLSLLQAERELQRKKSLLLSAKLANIRSMEQRCLMLEHHNSALNFNILAHKSEIERLELNYNTSAQQFRVLKSELEDIEESEKEKDKFYDIKGLEMKEFQESVERRVSKVRQQVDQMRISVMELKSSLEETMGKNECLSNPEIAAAERQKAELLLNKENLERSLASNYQLRAHLEKRLYKILIS